MRYESPFEEIQSTLACFDTSNNGDFLGRGDIEARRNSEFADFEYSWKLAGFGMAINVISKQVMATGWIGWIAGAVIFVGGHVFNIANSALSAFVHSMRLQFVEFFTKFIKGGGKNFEPLRKEYKSAEVEE